ncbi:hypothetical protein MKW92_008065 [Papaver armeniacum]|nr:hypothetical protein MKW92_008065 [Papaver armeniacum]
MREIGLKKEPGNSWVKIGNADHVSVANDDAHPLNKKIRKAWVEVSEKIKQAGYVPDTSHVLVFTVQQEREARLQFHSEKIVIIKNIRVCGDCHSAIKFVSKVMERDVRYHHFSGSSCSGKDYW